MAEADDRQQSRVDQAINLAQTARFFVFTIQKAGTAIGALGTIGAPFWIALGVILGFTFVIGLIGSQGLTGTTPTTSAGSFVPGSVRPPSDDFNTLHENLKNKETGYGIEFVGFDDSKLYYNYLKWAWEKLEQVKNTRFLQLVKSKSSTITVRKVDRDFNQPVGCDTLEMSGKSSADGQPYGEQLFKLVFIHELSHIIHGCNREQSRIDELSGIVPTQESYITAYSESSLDCPITKTNNLTEDYAEMISYFLNPEWNEVDFGYWRRDSKCLPPRSGKPYDRGFPLHQKLAAEILGVNGPLTPAPVTELAKFSCPVAGGGEPWYGSSQADPRDGHCGTRYNVRLEDPNNDCLKDPNNTCQEESEKLKKLKKTCEGNTRRGKSMDRKTGGATGNDIILPQINNQTVEWQFTDQFDLSAKDCFAEEIVNPGTLNGGCGKGYVFQTPPVVKQTNGQNWVLHLLHMGPTSLQLNRVYNSGEVVGKTEAIHTHISIGKDIQNVSSQNEPGWKSVDTEMKLCQ